MGTAPGEAANIAPHMSKAAQCYRWYWSPKVPAFDQCFAIFEMTFFFFPNSVLCRILILELCWSGADTAMCDFPVQGELWVLLSPVFSRRAQSRIAQCAEVGRGGCCRTGSLLRGSSWLCAAETNSIWNKEPFGSYVCYATHKH